MPAEYIGLAALALIFAGTALATFVLAKNPIADRPDLGRRGLKRSLALEEGGVFKTIELPMRIVSGWVSGLALDNLRSKLDKQITFAGDYLGLTANDLIGLSIVSGVGSITFALLASNLLGLPSLMVVFAGAVGFYLPFLQLGGVRQERFKAVNRSLPTAIDLAALCMGAGLDFPGALRQVVEKASSRDVVIVEEFNRILQELELGHTRRKALEALAYRVPTEAVKDFVGTVVQAEEKGTPLAEVLTIQARMLRMRRSVMAEESAAKAGMMLMGPLMMMFICVLFLLVGPFIVKWMNSGM
ncbi:MAG: type II secretion system F family protein [Deltaproteobacteria bacterium]|nr:type II secretion system F family protein [Deltaproteobacteria bacterium]